MNKRSKILVIGERANFPRISDDAVVRLRESWYRHTWNVAVRMRMTGGSLSRLKRLIPVSYDVINLLSPDNKCGTWDVDLARVMADAARSYFIDDRGYKAVVLLGRRLTNLFFPRAEFEFTGKIGSLSALCVPHPSGRSRYWNIPNNEERVRHWITNLVSRYSKGAI